MRLAALLAPGLKKEILALLPVWTAGVAALAVVTVVDAPLLGILICLVASAAVGALSMGHEYANRTLSLLLSQPVDRRRLFGVKLTALLPMLLTLNAFAVGFFLRSETFSSRFGGSAAFFLLSMVCGLFLAPWLSMLCRSPLAAIVFGISIPGMVHVIGDVVEAIYGSGPHAGVEGERLSILIMWYGLAGLSVIGGISSWRMFMRLEAIDRRESDLRLPDWITHRIGSADVDVARPRHAVWLLLKKEVRLQHLTIAVGGVYLVVSLGLSMAHQLEPAFNLLPGAARGRQAGRTAVIQSDIIEALVTILLPGALALLSGSLASAEERQLGTHESQLLLPMSTRLQWLVKAGTALGLTMVLAAGVPVALRYLGASPDDLAINPLIVSTLILLTATSLFVSSVSSSGLRALVFSLPVVISGAALVGVVVAAVKAGYRLVRGTGASGVASHAMAGSGLTDLQMTFVLGAGFVALVLWFALVNHRTSDRAPARVWRQVAWMFGYIVVATGVLSMIQ